MKSHWNEDYADVWDKILPPSKPSQSEIMIYTDIAHKLKNKLKRKIDILILGSTKEFREWAYEEKMNVTIVDFSKKYHDNISKLIDKNVIKKEKLIIEKWEDINFQEEFDIIIGDSVIGNIAKEKHDEFINKISSALRNNGIFMGKTYLAQTRTKSKRIEEIINEYKNEYYMYNPFSYLIYDLAMISTNNNVINFKKIYDTLLKLRKKEIITDKILDSFESIKKLGEKGFKFYVLTIKEYELLLEKYMKITNILYGKDIYSKNFPIYIVENKEKKWENVSRIRNKWKSNQSVR